MMSSAEQALLRLALSGERRRWTAMKRDPHGHQRRALARILSASERTRFGREHGLSARTTYEQFRRRSPLRKYEDFAPYLDAIRAGERDVLMPGLPKYWGRTGGTTGVDKQIPVYPGLVAQSQRTFRTALALHLIEHPETRVLGRKMVLLGSSSALRPGPAGIPLGFMSSIMVKELSPALKSFVLPGSRVDALPDWASKVEAVFKMTRNQDVTVFGAMPPWMAAFFRYVVERTGRPVLELWPNLGLLVHSGVAMDSYREEIKKLLGPSDGKRPSFKNGFGSTEGNFAIQERDADREMTILPADVFFEFVSLDSYLEGRGEENRVPLEGVLVGVEYALVLTTPGGLYSYVIGDTVRFASASVEGGYRLAISGRTAQFLNLAGEKVTVDQVLAAVEHASRTTGAQVTEFTLFPRNADAQAGSFLPGHEWLVEFERSPASLTAFEVEVDAELSRQNPLYGVRRASQFGATPLLAAPVVRSLTRGTYENWQALSGRQGGQFKVPRISSRPDLRDSLVSTGGIQT